MDAEQTPRAEPLWTAEEAADYLQFSPTHVRRLARLGELEGRKLGKEWRFEGDAIKRFISGEPARTVATP